MYVIRARIEYTQKTVVHINNTHDRQAAALAFLLIIKFYKRGFASAIDSLP